MNGLQNVSTKEDFLEYIRRLEIDFLNNGNEWENKSIPQFLEALNAWVHDMDGYYENIGREIPVNINWRFFAEALYAAKYYE